MNEDRRIIVGVEEHNSRRIIAIAERDGTRAQDVAHVALELGLMVMENPEAVQPLRRLLELLHTWTGPAGG